MKNIFSAGAKPADLYIIAPGGELIHGHIRPFGHILPTFFLIRTTVKEQREIINLVVY
jgi:hypothetical protein